MNTMAGRTLSSTTIALLDDEPLLTAITSDGKAAVIRRHLLYDHQLMMASSLLAPLFLFLFLSFGFLASFSIRETLLLPFATLDVGLVWVGLGAVLLVWIASSSSAASALAITKWHLLTFGCMCAFVTLSSNTAATAASASLLMMPRLQMYPVLAALTLINILLQAGLLVRTIRSCSPSETIGQKCLFYGSLYALYAYFTGLSMVFILQAFHSWPGTASFYHAVASCLFYAYAAWLGSKVASPRKGCAEVDEDEVDDDSSSSTSTTSNSTRTIFACSAGSMERPNYWAPALLTVMLHTPTAVALLLSFSKCWTAFAINSIDAADDVATTSLLLDLTLFCFASAVFLQLLLLAPLRLYVRSDASIAVETYGQTYVYDKVVRIHTIHNNNDVEADDDSAKDDEAINNKRYFCFESPMRRTVASVAVMVVVVELSDGRILHLTPRQPDEFVDAVRRAIIISNNNQQQQEQQPEKELLLV